MSLKIEFHLLQSFPPANLNRDQLGQPKTCDFGGVRRARISSQCIKRSIRFHPDFIKYTEVPLGKRTKLLSLKISGQLIKTGRLKEEAEQVAQAFTGKLLGGMEKENPQRSTILFYISEEECDFIVNGINKNWEQSLNGDFSDLITHYKKEFSERNNSPDIALFGRMLASKKQDLNLTASCQVAHAISTHPIKKETDFFTAVDDLQSAEDAGAGMMGEIDFNSSTYYRYAAINWQQLVDNFGGENIDLANNTVMGFTSAIAKAIPTGKQSAFAAKTPPTFVLVVVREDGQAWSLANAFEKPVTNYHGKSILERSIDAIDKHWHQLNTVYGDKDQPVKPFLYLVNDEYELNYLKEARVESLAALITAVFEALPQE